MKTKEFGLTETKLFHFHRIFKNGERGSSEPPLDPPLLWIVTIDVSMGKYVGLKR